VDRPLHNLVQPHARIPSPIADLDFFVPSRPRTEEPKKESGGKAPHSKGPGGSPFLSHDMNFFTCERRRHRLS
jgi:hypothetical protein